MKRQYLLILFISLSWFNVIGQTAEEYIKSAHDKAELGNNLGAIQDWDKAIALNPENDDAYYSRGLLKLALGEKNGACLDLSKAGELGKAEAYPLISKHCNLPPVNALGYTAIEYGKSAVQKEVLGDYHGAVQDYNKAIELDSNYVAAYNKRGIVKGNLGDYHGAIQDYNKAIEFNPNYADAYNNRGNSKRGLGDTRGAMQDYNKATELNPNFTDAYINKGNTKRANGDFLEALQDFNKAIELNLKYAHAYYDRGRCKYDLGDIDGACLDWSKAGELGVIDAYDLIKKYCN